MRWWALVFVAGLIGIQQAAPAAQPHALSSWPLRWSADGSTLFLTRSDAAAGPYGRTYALSRSGRLAELTDDGKPASVVPSPGGERLAVLSLGFALTVVEPGGARIPVAEKAADPMWSPDGSALAYVTGDQNLNGHVNVYDAASRRSRELGFGFDPVWSPDGTMIATADENHITVLDLAGDGGIQLAPTHGDPRTPVWSPDGASIAFASGLGWASRRLYVSPVASSGSRRVARHVESVLSWSPDGRTIAVKAGDTVRTVRADGVGRDRVIVDGATSFIVAPDWSRSALSLASWHGYDLYVADWPLRSPRRVGPSQCTVIRERCLTGSDGSDRVSGGNRREVILAGAGDDTIYGRGGNDRLEGSLGSDTLFGGSGHNFAFGGPGSDQLYGGPQADRLDGDGGSDRLVGGHGRDLLWGDTGQDSVLGGEGNDVIGVRDGERDRVDCGAGRDRVFADMSDVLVACERVSRRPL